MIQYFVDIFVIEFIDFMLKDRSLTDFTNLFLPDDLKNKKQ